MKQQNLIVASIGCGVIGYSWALAFARGGYFVYAHNRNEEGCRRTKRRIRESLDALCENHAMSREEAQQVEDRIRYTSSVEEAVKEAFFIQESTIEQYEMKYAIIEEIEKYAKDDAIIASSTSGLLLSEMVRYARLPERFVAGHPYNPPHLIPLVEIAKGERTSQDTVERTKKFYESIGNVPIVLQKEVPGFVCNRLQIALYREICHLVMSGVCTIEDADKAVTFGPGIRWGIMGPSLVFELGGGTGGVKGLLEGLKNSMELWLADMADFKTFPKEWPEIAQKGVLEELSNRPEELGNDHDSLEKYRDAMLLALRRLHGK